MAAARPTCRDSCGARSGDRDAACLEAAWFLASPPFAIGALSLLLATGLAAIAGAWLVAAVFGAGLGAARPRARHRPRPGSRRPAHLARAVVAPWYLVWKAVVQLRALASVLRRDDYYGPTARAPDARRAPILGPARRAAAGGGWVPPPERKGQPQRISGSAGWDGGAVVPAVVGPLVAGPRAVEVGDREPHTTSAAGLDAAAALEDVVSEHDPRRLVAIGL